MSDAIQFKRSDAWIFLAIGGAAGDGTAHLADIMGTADAINHAIPMDRELERGFTRLLQAGLIRQDGRELGLTAAGRALVERCDRKTKYWLKQWDFLDEVLTSEPFPTVVDVAYALEPDEGKRAYGAYRKRIRKIMKD